MTIGVVKYGMGNVASVQKALKKLGYQSIITDNHDELRQVDVILLPGVGSFTQGMDNLKASGLIALLTEEVIDKKKPFIGICLGMQLLATFGNEPEKVAGLGWIDGEVVKIEAPAGVRVPHLGWNAISTNKESDLYAEFNGQDYYFIHSYRFKAENRNEITITVNYAGETIAALQKDNIYAMQFHPEKSQEVGLKLLKKVIDQYA